MTFGPSNAAHEYFSTPDAITGKAKTAVVGKTFVQVTTGGTVQNPNLQTCPAGVRPFGVAGWNADPLIDEGVVTVQRKGVWSVTAAAAIAAGADIAVGASGKAVTAAAEAVVIGTALAAAATGEDVAVSLNLV